ncbi:hypothetical protein [Hyphococcus lacteus]|uniref:DUF4760 domain-containing protein n=1 Tax=Hyphococcus lacteus TaxID=3143536 RepID=A0ABV3Z8V0_9PROT
MKLQRIRILVSIPLVIKVTILAAILVSLAGFLLWSGDLCVPWNASDACSVDWQATGGIFSAIAIGITAYVAHQGLKTWRDQHHAKLAMEALSAIHEGVADLRSAISSQAISDFATPAQSDLENSDRYRAYLLNRSFESARRFRDSAINSRRLWAKIETLGSQIRANEKTTVGGPNPWEELVSLRYELLDDAYLLKAYEEHIRRGETTEFGLCGNNQPETDLERAKEMFPHEIRGRSGLYIGETEISNGSFSDRQRELREKIQGIVTMARYTSFQLTGKEWTPENKYEIPG